MNIEDIKNTIDEIDPHEKIKWLKHKDIENKILRIYNSMKKIKYLGMSNRLKITNFIEDI